MLRELKKLSGMESSDDEEGYSIMRYWHPDSKKGVEFIKNVDTLEEAQEHCGSDEASHKCGPTSEWYFDGFVRGQSKTKHITLW